MKTLSKFLTAGKAAARIWTNQLNSKSRLDGNAYAIFMYHQVLQKQDPFFPGVSAKNFREQLTFLKKNYEIMALTEIFGCLNRREMLPKNAIAITFDDGHLSTYENAFPILKELGVPATVYLATGAIDNQEPIWTDKIAYLISGFRGEQVVLKRDEGVEIRLSLMTQAQKLEAIQQLKTLLKNINNKERQTLIDQTETQAGLNLSHKTFMMNWDQVKEMAKHHIEFGAHTVTHPILSQVTVDEAWEEISHSKKRVEQMLETELHHFAYPNGGAEDFSEGIKALVKQAGFQSASSTLLGINQNEDCVYSLKRIYGAEEPILKFVYRLNQLEI